MSQQRKYNSTKFKSIKKDNSVNIKIYNLCRVTIIFTFKNVLHLKTITFKYLMQFSLSQSPTYFNMKPYLITLEPKQGQCVVFGKAVCTVYDATTIWQLCLPILRPHQSQAACLSASSHQWREELVLQRSQCGS